MVILLAALDFAGNRQVVGYGRFSTTPAKGQAVFHAEFEAQGGRSISSHMMISKRLKKVPFRDHRLPRCDAKSTLGP